ncbi:hypothetical protein K2P56_03840 [Patescibacteria group bacterium]|nr:hypothetical protein [Patescibacteria group bacterium]
MSEAKRILAASRKVFIARQEERAFSDRSEDVRACEPEPTLEIAKSFRPKTIPSMYETARIAMDERVGGTVEKISKFRTYD